MFSLDIWLNNWFLTNGEVKIIEGIKFLSSCMQFLDIYYLCFFEYLQQARNSTLELPIKICLLGGKVEGSWFFGIQGF